jgi:lipopolysaccharide transport system ATP-binding protein
LSEVLISVENLGKRYRIRHQPQRQRYATIRDVLTNSTKSLARRFWSCVRRPFAGAPPARGPAQEDFWALQNVSFEITQGQSVGIIGRNGAGKSTLLKILSRVTEPTTGRVRIRGRAASLLEVGTGFHPELTGRENVYLNGAILGMSRMEIRRKFDEIVAFAEIEKFLDTPVKRYSSGMYVRLAFAVAAHLEAEILVVDEVLAVGDTRFQRKCLGKISEVAKQGRTVLFVSHNMGVIAELCRRVFWLDQGRVRKCGGAQDVITTYLKSHAGGKPNWFRPAKAAKTRVSLQAVQLLSGENDPIEVVEFKEPFQIEIVYEVFQPVEGCTIALCLRNVEGLKVIVSSERDSTRLDEVTREVGRYRAVCAFPGGLLRHGLYYLTVGAYIENRETIDRYENLLAFEISAVDSPATDGRQGVVTPILPWHVDAEEPVSAIAR